MTLFEYFQYLIIALYFMGALFFIVGSVKKSQLLGKIGNLSAVFGFVFHTIDILVGITLYKDIIFTGGDFYFSLLAWSFILVYFSMWWKLRNTFFALTASPLALIIFVISLGAHSLKVTIPVKLAGLFIGLHIGTIFICIALLAIASGAGIAFIYLNNKIKSKANISSIGKDMPSLGTFDKVNHWAIVIGFPLYTLSLASGFFWARQVYEKMFSWDPKEVVSLVVWFLFAVLFHQRIMLGWKGKKPAYLVIIVFVITMISFLGINFFLQTHHSFKA